MGRSSRNFSSIVILSFLFIVWLFWMVNIIKTARSRKLCTIGFGFGSMLAFADWRIVDRVLAL